MNVSILLIVFCLQLGVAGDNVEALESFNMTPEQVEEIVALSKHFWDKNNKDPQKTAHEIRKYVTNKVENGKWLVLIVLPGTSRISYDEVSYVQFYYDHFAFVISFLG